MKRFNCFFALVCLLMMFSCQKPEGTLPGSWMNAGGNGPVRCSITANMDYAVYEVNVNLGSASLDQLQLDKLELHYFLKGQDQQKTLTILSDTVLRSNYQKKDTIWGLIPNSDYQYSMLIADFFNEKMTDTLPFRTLPVDVPSVTLDTAMLIDGLVWCYGKLQFHWRAPITAESIFPQFWSNKDVQNVNIDNVEITQQQRIGDYVLGDYCFSHDLGNDVTGSFAVKVVNSWNVSAWSDTLAFSLFEIGVITDVPNVIGAHHVWAYGKPTKDGEGITINKLGFCLADHYHPTTSDIVYDVSPGMMVWESVYQLRIEDLEPNTNYFIRAYLQINSDTGPVYYGDERAFRTWSAIDVELLEPNPEQILPTSAYLEAMVGDFGSFSLYENVEYGFIWKEVDANDPDDDTVTFENNLFLNYQPCNNLNAMHFSSVVENLSSESKYWVRAYVKYAEIEECFYSDAFRLDTPR